MEKTGKLIIRSKTMNYLMNNVNVLKLNFNEFFGQILVF